MELVGFLGFLLAWILINIWTVPYFDRTGWPQKEPVKTILFLFHLPYFTIMIVKWIFVQIFISVR